MKKLYRWLLIAALFGWLFYGIDASQLWRSFEKFNPFGLFLTFLAVLLSDLLVALRWYFLSGYKHSFISSFEAAMLAFFLNIFAPAKLGDISKIYYMHKKENHSLKESASIFLIERLFDVALLGFIILFSAIFIYPNSAFVVLALSLLLISVFLFYLLFDRPLLIKMVRYLPTKRIRVLALKISKLIQKSLTWQKAVGAALLTLLVWGGYYFNNFVFFFTATDFGLTLFQIFTASTLAFAVSAIPITPGGIGTFQAAFVLSLGWYGVPKEDALAASITLQILYILPAALVSLYLLLTKEFLWSKDVSAKKL